TSPSSIVRVCPQIDRVIRIDRDSGRLRFEEGDLLDPCLDRHWIITHARGYFNTSIMVTRLSSSKYNFNGGRIRSKSKSSMVEITRVHCPSI
ncbi:hypothetical protein LINGRAHAP2_LOCUS23776, partial [Linum grandiflorum]